MGKISYVSPVFDESTRSAIVRAVIPNDSGEWRPGTFVRGIILDSIQKSVPVVQSNAIQFINEDTVVFLPGESNSFIPQKVKIGKRDNDFVEILSGLEVGDRYVSEGAFDLKANIITRSLGSHAGHGH